MGFFINRFFNGELRLAHNLEHQGKKRLELWESHLSNYAARDKLAKFFSPENVDEAIKNIDELDAILARLDELLSTDFINILDDKKSEKQILDDLRRLTSEESRNKTHDLRRLLAEETHNQNNFYLIFKKILDVLKLELHVIKLIRKRPLNIRELLVGLYRLISHQEAFLYDSLKKEQFLDELKGKKIESIANAIILGEELKLDAQSSDDKFVNYITDLLENDNSEHYYWRLGENIFSELAKMAGIPLTDDEDYYGWIEKFDNFLYDDKVLSEVVMRFHRKADEREIKLIMLAFRRSYNLKHFEGLIHHLMGI